MTEPEKPKSEPLFSRKNLIHLVCSVLVSAFLGGMLDLVFDSHARSELNAVRANAYVSISQFAPWNIGLRYIEIVTTQGDEAREFARRQQEQTSLLRGAACDVHFSSGDNPCEPRDQPEGLRGFYLSAHVPTMARFVTAFFDLLLHAFVDQGLIGFLVAGAQVFLGVLLTRLAVVHFQIKWDGAAYWLIGFPLAVLFLGGVAAIPLWLLALMAATGLKAMPLLGLGAQAGATGWLVSFVSRKVAEVVGHAVIMKQVERVVRN